MLRSTSMVPGAIALLFILFACSQPPVPAAPSAPPGQPPAIPTPASPGGNASAPGLNTTQPRTGEKPPDIVRGTPDIAFQVDVYEPAMAWHGTTLFADNHDPENPRIVEVNMLGEVVWEYFVPLHLKRFTNPGFDVEWLPNNNVLFVLPTSGIYEIDRKGNTVWSYLTNKVSHDADRLPNGNTIFVYGAFDQKSDAQVTEVSPGGQVIWTWRAMDHFDKPPYRDISNEGWTHTNGAARLPNGNTIISPRNFNLLIEVDPQGKVLKTVGEGILRSTHGPKVLPDGNVLFVDQGRPHRAVELDWRTGMVVWQSPGFELESLPVRAAERLPNGNTLITAANKIVEVTNRGRVVWQLSLKGVTFDPVTRDGPRLGFYKAERIESQR